MLHWIFIVDTYSGLHRVDHKLLTEAVQNIDIIANFTLEKSKFGFFLNFFRGGGVN